LLIHPDRLFPAEPGTRKIARTLYECVQERPLISPHGHTQASWFARNEPFPGSAAKLLVQPDHYIFRMLYSQGITLEDLEIGQPELKESAEKSGVFSPVITSCFAERRRACGWTTPSRSFSGWSRDSRKSADVYFDAISEKLRTPEFLPRVVRAFQS